MKYLRRLLFSAFSLVVGSNGVACVAPSSDPSWVSMLAKSDGAVIVRITKVADVSPRVLVQLVRDEAIYDPSQLFRGKMIVATLVPSPKTNPHETLSFWMGAGTAEARTPWNCQPEQGVDLGKKYLLLLSVDGAFTLEPIYSDDDPWLVLVRNYFHDARKLPSIALKNVDGQITPKGVASCSISANAAGSYDTFQNCVAAAYPRGPVQMLIELSGGAKVYVKLSDDRSKIPSSELFKIFGSDLGLKDGISLRSFFEK